MSLPAVQQYFSLENKVIIITGATGVLGESFVDGVAGMGATVVLLGRNEEVGNQRAEDLKAKGNNALFIKTDVLSRSELDAARDKVLASYGKIDGLVNAAGGNLPEAVIAPDKDIF